MLGTIVVGVGSTSGSSAALAWSLRRAAATDAALIVVTAVIESAVGGDLAPVPMTGATRELVVGETLAWQRRLLGAGDRMPSDLLERVRIEQRVRLGPPSLVIASAARDADLVVVGVGRRGRYPAVARDCARRVACPVVVIDGDHPR